MITSADCLVQVAYTREVYGERMTYGPTVETTANARLITAAPEMLEALRLIAETDSIDAALDPQRAVRIAREVIAKTTGDKS